MQTADHRRIVNGNLADDGKVFPYFIYVKMDQYAWCWGYTTQQRYLCTEPNYCGASLIFNNLALTAAHCIYKNFSQVTLAFPPYYNFDDDTNSVVVTDSKDIVIHENFKNDSGHNDIGLIYLPIDVQNRVNLLQLPKHESFVGQTAEFVGYGYYKVVNEIGSADGKLRYFYSIIISEDVCNEVWYPIESTAICACDNATVPRMSSCFGDSGGPLVIRDKYGIETVIGLAAGVKKSCNPKLPQIYTRVSSYDQWIRKKYSDLERRRKDINSKPKSG